MMGKKMKDDRLHFSTHHFSTIHKALQAHVCRVLFHERCRALLATKDFVSSPSPRYSEEKGQGDEEPFASQANS